MHAQKLFAVAMFSILAGCAVQKPVIQSEVIPLQNHIVTLTIPAPELYGSAPPINPSDLVSRIKFSNYHNQGQGNYPDVDALQWKANDRSFMVERYKGFLAPNTSGVNSKNSVSYNGVLNIAKNSSSYQLSFSFENKSSFKEQNVLIPNSRYNFSFDFPEVSANLGKAELLWKFEVDSEFNTDSTYANFVRLARKEVYRGAGEKDPVTGKIFKERFWIRVAGREIPVMVETYPYKNGSKAVIYAAISGTVSGSIVDFTSNTEALKNEIVRIVKA